jgi:hypothetical protein
MKTFYKITKKKILFKIFGIRIYSITSLIVIILFSPWIYFYRKISIINLNKKNKIIKSKTPKNIIDEVGEHLLQNLVISKKISEYNNSKYIFALQPTLLVSTPKTEMDNKIIKSLSNYKNIDMVQIYKDYYNYIQNKLSLKKDFDSKNFLDLSNIFENTHSQNYIDTVHTGNRGQEIISNNIGKKILNLENNKYVN